MAISLNKIVRVEWIDCRVDTLPTTAEESALVLRYIIANFHGKWVVTLVVRIERTHSPDTKSEFIQWRIAQVSVSNIIRKNQIPITQGLDKLPLS